MAFNVSTVYTAVDKVSPTLAKMSAGNKKFASSATKAAARAERSFRRLESPLNRVGAGIKNIAAGAGILSAGFAVNAAAESVLSFDQNIRAAGAKFKLFNEDGKETFIEIQKFAQEMGATTLFSAAEAADGLNFLAAAGFDAEEAMSSLPSVLNLATASQTDLGRASDIATDSVGALGPALNKYETRAEKLAAVSDLLANTTASFNTDMESLFETIKDSGPIWANSGLSVEEYAATVGVMANSGIKGTKAGTAIKNMLLNLQAPTSGASKALRRLGVDVDNGEGKLKSMALITQDMVKALKPLSVMDRQKALDEVFGRRAIVGSQLVFNEGREGLEKFTAAMDDSTGVSKKMADFMGAGMSGKVKTLKSAFDSISFAVADVFSEEIDAGVKNMTEIARSTKAWVKENKTLLKVIFTIVKTLVKFWIVSKLIRTTYKGVLFVQKAWNITLGISAALQRKNMFALRGNTTALVAHRTATMFAGTATKGFTGVMAALDAVMLANPIGIIIVLILALAAAFIIAWNNSEKFRSSVMDGYRGVSEVFMVVAEQITTSVKTITQAIHDTISAYEALFDLDFDKAAFHARRSIEEPGKMLRAEENSFEFNRQRVINARMRGAAEGAKMDKIRLSDILMTDEIKDEIMAINPAASSESIRREREERVSSETLNINLRDPGGAIDSVDKPQRMPVNIVSTSGGFN